MLKYNITQKDTIEKGNLLKKLFIIVVFITILLSSLASVNGHILLIGDSTNDLPEQRKEAIDIYEKLILDGYPVVVLIGENATGENIVKGMYGADAIIYCGHGSDSGYYDGKGGTSKGPYSIPTVDEWGIWTNDKVLSEGWGSLILNNNNFIAPIKKGASVIFLHTCFASGKVENTTVANPDETIYRFNTPYVNSGANIYASGYYQVYEGYYNGVLGQELANGGEKSLTFKDANNLAIYEDKVDTDSSKEYNNLTFYTNKDYDSLFIGDMNSYVLPPASECDEYDSNAADSWYNSGKRTDDPIYDKSINPPSNDNIDSIFAYIDDYIDSIFVYVDDFVDTLLDI